MRCAVDYLFALSDPELLAYWSLFSDYPTRDPEQRRRVDSLLSGLQAEEAGQRRARASLGQTRPSRERPAA